MCGICTLGQPGWHLGANRVKAESRIDQRSTKGNQGEPLQPAHSERGARNAYLATKSELSTASSSVAFTGLACT